MDAALLDDVDNISSSASLSVTLKASFRCNQPLHLAQCMNKETEEL